MRIADSPENPHSLSSSEAALRELLDELRAETGVVTHAINNPLTVITGNAQLILEMARLEGLESSLLTPIEDIDAAAQQLSQALARLSALRERIAEALETSDGLKGA